MGGDTEGRTGECHHTPQQQLRPIRLLSWEPLRRAIAKCSGRWIMHAADGRRTLSFQCRLDPALVRFASLPQVFDGVLLRLIVNHLVVVLAQQDEVVVAINVSGSILLATRAVGA